MAYVDYSFYTDEYLGDVVTEESSFDKLEKRARVYLDSHTKGRLKEESVVSVAVKECMCELVDILSKAKGSTLLKKSESVDSWSVNYAVSDRVSLDSVLYASIVKHLGNTNYLCLW